MDTFVARAAALQLVQNALLSSANSEEVRTFIQDLPVLPKEQIPLEDNCPICLLPFLEILADEEESTKKGDKGGGVTKLEGCGHIFCRRDLIEWIRTHHLNCPTCRFQFIRVDTYQDDASSDGGEYLPSSEGEEDIEVDANASELADFPVEDRYDLFAPDWESEAESGPIVDPELEGHEVMTEAWIDDYDPEYGDVGVEGGDLDFEPGYMEEGPVDPGLDSMMEGDSNFDPCLEEGDPDTDAFRPGFNAIEPEFNLTVEDSSWDPPEFDPAEDGAPQDPSALDPAEEDGPHDSPEFDPAEGDGPHDSPEFDPTEAQGEYFDPELAMDETLEDTDSLLEELECEPYFDPTSDAEYELDCMDDALDGLEVNHPAVGSLSDSEQEELEVELGLTDGESNGSSFSEDEIQGPIFPTQPVAVQISVDNGSTDETIISCTYNPQFLK